MTPFRIILLAMAALTAVDSAAAQRRGSIYDPTRGPVSPIADKTAYRLGDLVTVLIRENQDLRNEERTDLAKDSTLNYQLLDFVGNPDSFTTIPIRSQKSDTFGGATAVEKIGAFEARLTAMVIDVMPNGNMVIEGRREIQIDQERKVLEFRGVVRRFDVLRNNTVESELVADAYVSYTGTGPITNSNRRRGLSSWLYSAVDWIWPF